MCQDFKHIMKPKRLSRFFIHLFDEYTTFSELNQGCIFPPGHHIHINYITGSRFEAPGAWGRRRDRTAATTEPRRGPRVRLGGDGDVRRGGRGLQLGQAGGRRAPV